MTTLAKIETTWAGFPGAPGKTIMYSTVSGIATVQAALHDFFDAIKGHWVGAFTWQVEGAGVTISDVDGLVDGAWSQTAPAVVTGTHVSNAFAGPCGTKVVWSTQQIANHRLLKGATMLVPIDASAFDSDGTIISGVKESLQTAADAFVSDAGSVARIFSRPRPAMPVGVSAAIVSATVPERLVVRRSRST